MLDRLKLGFIFCLLILPLSHAMAEDDNSLEEIDVDIELDQDSYFWSDTVVANISLTNTSEEIQELNFNDGCIFDLDVHDTSGSVFTSSSADQVCADIMTTLELEPGESVSYESSVDLAQLVGYQYQLYLSVENTENNISETILLPFVKSISIDAEFEYPYSYPEYNIGYRVGDEVVLKWTVSNFGDQDFTLESHCGFNGFVHLYYEYYILEGFPINELEEAPCERETLIIEAGEEHVFDLTIQDPITGESYVLSEEGEFTGQIRILTDDATYYNFYIQIWSLKVGEPPFTDLEDHWAFEDVMSMYENGHISGYDDGTFKPDQSITRAEFIKLTVESLANDSTEYHGNSFLDVFEEDWFYEYVELAYYEEIISGNNGSFRPNEPITRAEALSVLFNTMGFTKDTSSLFYNIFEDVEEEWQIPYIMTAYNFDMISGYNDENGEPKGIFGPNDPLTRGEAAKIIGSAHTWDALTWLVDRNKNIMSGGDNYGIALDYSSQTDSLYSGVLICENGSLLTYELKPSEESEYAWDGTLTKKHIPISNIEDQLISLFYDFSLFENGQTDYSSGDSINSSGLRYHFSRVYFEMIVDDINDYEGFSKIAETMYELIDHYEIYSSMRGEETYSYEEFYEFEEPFCEM